MSTRAKVYALDARGGVIASQYHHCDGYEWHALSSIVQAYLNAGEGADVVAVMSALLTVWRGEWSASHEAEIGAAAPTDLDYEYAITVQGLGRLMVEVTARGDLIAGTDDDGETQYITLPATTQRLDGMEAITARMVAAIRTAAECHAGTPFAAAYADEVARLEDLAAHAVETATSWQVMAALAA